MWSVWTVCRNRTKQSEYQIITWLIWVHCICTYSIVSFNTNLNPYFSFNRCYYNIRSREVIYYNLKSNVLFAILVLVACPKYTELTSCGPSISILISRKHTCISIVCVKCVTLNLAFITDTILGICNSSSLSCITWRIDRNLRNSFIYTLHCSITLNRTKPCR